MDAPSAIILDSLCSDSLFYTCPRLRTQAYEQPPGLLLTTPGPFYPFPAPFPHSSFTSYRPRLHLPFRFPCVRRIDDRNPATVLPTPRLRSYPRPPRGDCRAPTGISEVMSILDLASIARMWKEWLGNTDLPGCLHLSPSPILAMILRVTQWRHWAIIRLQS